jgi:sugar O-acyltransferase (sialic acid O-acetyltransferase NeuD family)
MVNGRRIFVYGAGGHGKVVADTLIARGHGEFAGFVDDSEDLREREVLGFAVHGGGEWLRQAAVRAEIAVALGIGSAEARRMILERCSRWGIEILTVVHGSATVSKFAQLGRGTVVMAHAVINADAKLGAGVIVNSAAVVEHDVEVGEFAHVAPNATMGGGSRLGALSHLGLGAAVLQGVRVGSHTTIGAGAVVTRDVPHHVVAMGVPARIHRRIEEEDLAPVSAALERVKT